MAERAGSFETFVNDMATCRFSHYSAKSFKDLRKATNYHAIDKRDGGLLTVATKEGTIIEGPELEEAVISHFAKVHCQLPELQKATFPPLYVTPQLLVEMSRNVSQNKAITFDGFDDSLFNFRNGCSCRIAEWHKLSSSLEDTIAAHYAGILVA